MNDVFDYLYNKIKLQDGDTIVIGNSFGPDSMALLHILLEIRKKINIFIICAHVNHNIRVESFSEKENLQKYCEKNGILFEWMAIEKYGDDNFHNEARTIRYNFFDDIIRKYNANYLMTAHHGDDLIETILMRISRGSTLKGYSGFSKYINKGNYKLVRPLIFVTKQEIEDYDKKNQVPYAIDKSNYKSTYTRNRYRKEILPFLKKEDKNIHQKFLKFSEKLEEYDNYLTQNMLKVINKIYVNNQLDIKRFLIEEDLIKTKIIYYILELIYQDDLILINDIHVSLIMNIINSSKANTYIYLPNNVKATKIYDKLVISNDIKDITNYEIEFNEFAILPNGHSIKKVDKCETNGNDVCRILYKDVELPLYIRTRRIGDKMSLKKIAGHKKIKSIFIDSKIPINKRDKWPIVVDAKDNIIWIPGLKKSKISKQKNEKYDIILKYI